jgi:chemotaxis protein methyltransferase CheR
VSEFYRDPAFFLTLKEKVFPQLTTYPAIRIWHAGCANGEEVYSLAILLEEAGLLERCTIFATDFNDRALHAAEAGFYDTSKIEDACTRYESAGGTNTLRDYFTFSASHAKIKHRLTAAVTFANHNLATDQSFGDMHLILCRNTFIYFNGKLQNRAVRLFSESLVPRAWLALGSQETLRFCEAADAFELTDPNYPIYQERRLRVHGH